MALSDKNILITPSIGATADPKIVFSGADATTSPQNVIMQVYPTNNGTLSIDGSVGQMFSVNSTMTGTIFSANDISGIPSIEVLDTGLVKIAQYNGNVTLGSTTATSSIDIGNGATISGATKTISVGSNGVAGSTTTVSVGSSAGTSNIDLYGNVLVKSATGALGYGVGSGGTVTQTTSRNTAVTLNKLSGSIVIFGQNNANDIEFDFNNSFIGLNDTVIFNLVYPEATLGVQNWIPTIRIRAAGITRVYIANWYGNQLTNMTLNFTIIKGSTT